MDCPAIFASEEIDKPSGHLAMQWEMIPEHIQVLIDGLKTTGNMTLR